MKRLERQLLWQSRIQAVHTSSEASVAAWCATQNIPVQSMYHWLRKLRTQTKIQPAFTFCAIQANNWIISSLGSRLTGNLYLAGYSYLHLLYEIVMSQLA